MPFDRAKTALATLEEKLRRQLGLAGVIGAEFAPHLTPVMITTDLREPGNSFYRGRHFAVAQALNWGAGTDHVTVQFAVDVIVLGMRFMPGAAGTNNAIYVTAPGQALPVAVTANCGVWIDRKTQAVDLVPISFGGPAALAGTAGTIANIVYASALLVEQVVPLTMYMPALSAITFRSNTAGNGSWGIWGRIAEQV